jgi:hypothetical protein
MTALTGFHGNKLQFRRPSASVPAPASAMTYHLAQVNVALARAPLESDVMKGFTEAIDEINMLAESSPGFLWRFKTEEGNATSIRAFPDPRIIVNMSLWQDLPTLKNYVYRSMHGRFFARRAEWFDKMETPHLALWWVPAGTQPTLDEAKARLEALHRRGESDYAFTFRASFPAPEPVKV